MVVGTKGASAQVLLLRGKRLVLSTVLTNGFRVPGVNHSRPVLVHLLGMQVLMLMGPEGGGSSPDQVLLPPSTAMVAAFQSVFCTPSAARPKGCRWVSFWDVRADDVRALQSLPGKWPEASEVSTGA